MAPMTFLPGQRPVAPWGFHHWWGLWDTASQLPNVAGSTAQYNAEIQQGDLAWVVDVAQLFVCADPTPGAAVWTSVGGGGPVLAPIAPEYEWNLNGALNFITPQPGSFDGMTITDLALSGPGPFDGTRKVRRAGTIALQGLIQRVPAVFPGGSTVVEFYRIRGTGVTSLGVVGLGTLAPNAFNSFSNSPAVADLALNDLLFVALAGVAPVGAEDLSAYIQVTP